MSPRSQFRALTPAQLAALNAGPPVACMTGRAAAQEAADHIRAGDLIEAARWIERADRRFAGLLQLVARKTGAQ